MPQNQDYRDISSNFNTKIRSMEEKQRMLKERLLLVGQNLVETRERNSQEISGLKSDVNEMKEKIEKINKNINKIVVELDKKARKREIERLERQAKMFSPLELARIEDVKKMIEENGTD